MTDFPTTPFADSSVWTGSDFATDLSWKYELSKPQLDDIERALQSVKKAGLGVPEITAADFPLPSLVETLAQLGGDVQDGRGFAVLRGLPVEDYEFDDLELIYWGICSHLGIGHTQNSDGNFIHYVTAGKHRPNQGTRGVGFPRESLPHVDLMDIVSLLCVRQAPDNPASRLVSSAKLYNELLKRAPGDMARLHKGFVWDRMGEHDASETPTSGYHVPMFSHSDGQMSCRYNHYWIVAAAERSGVAYSDHDMALIELIDTITREHSFDLAFEQGDMQFANNYTTLHGRAAHKLQGEEDQHRVLMRIWLQVDAFRAFSDEAIIRYGVGQHGQLGWSAAEISQGAHQTPRPRRADGAVLRAG